MAKIKRKRFDAFGVKKDWTVHCSTKGEFYIEIPDEAAKLLGETTVRVNKLSSLEDAVHWLDQKYDKLRTMKKKVILYRFSSNCHILDDKEEYLFSSDDITFAEGTVIGIDYIVAFEMTLDGHKHHYEINSEGEKGSYIYKPNHAVFSWTPTREKFFENLQARLEQTILKANAFFDKGVKTQAKLIDSGMLLLSGPKEKKCPE